MSQGMFSRLYAWTLSLAGHPRAPTWLGVVSVAESSFFPVPVDVMLAPMVLARPQKAWMFAAIATIASVVGGVLGWVLGAMLIDSMLPLLEQWGYADAYSTARSWFANYGFWAVFAAGFTPIPFKVFTIAAGAANMLLPIFIAASLVGRGARFFLVAGLVRWGGPKIEPHLARYADQLGWAVLLLCVCAFLFVQFWH